MQPDGIAGGIPQPGDWDDDSAGLFSQIIESANGGIWVLDLQGRTIFANAQMGDILQEGPYELASSSMSDFLDEVGRVQILTVLKQELALGGLAEQVQCMFVRRDGCAVWCLVNRSPLRDDEGRHVGSINLVSDITDRRRIDEELRRSEEQLAQAQRVAHLGSWEFDIAADRITFSTEMYRILGLSPEVEVSYRNYLDRVHPEDRQRVDTRVSGCLEGDPSFEFDCRILRPNGEVAWVRSTGETVPGENGGLVLLGTTLDITADKATEDELRGTSARFRLLQSMASLANQTPDFKAVLRSAVAEICTDTGWSGGRVYLVAEDPRRLVAPMEWQLLDPRQQQTLDRLVGNADSPAVSDLAAQVFELTRPLMTATQIGGDAPGWVEAAAELDLKAGFAFPVLAGGDVLAVLEFVSPMPVEVDPAMLETWQQVGTQLAHVFQRQLASDELATARDVAMRSSRMKSEFLANMSHEIRTPMNAVIGLTGLLLETSLDEVQHQYAEGVSGAGAALLTLINDILDFSKLEAEKVELEAADFDVRGLVDEVGALLAPQADAKHLELIGHCLPEVPAALRGDAGRLRQILLNLASNAMKFTPAGVVGIKVMSAPLDQGRVALRFEVSDTGIGIAAEDRERLFDSFTQADASTTRRYGGSGLGLAICQRLVEAMSGIMDFESTLGVGSVFWFEVPLALGTTPATSLPTGAASELLFGRSVLVVDDSVTNHTDDDGTNHQGLASQLRSWGLEPELAGDAGSALALMHTRTDQSRRYDIVVLNLSMPDTDGLELAEKITTDPAMPRTPMIMLTSARAVDLAALKRAGVGQWMTKPVSSADFQDRLVRLVAAGGLSANAERRRQRRRGVSGSLGRVLVVEDNALNQMVAEGVVSGLGYEVDLVANGVAALQALRDHTYVAVLMDCHMPVMDGFQATHEIRRREGTRTRTPVIAMTASAMSEDRQRCLDAGMDDYISKPVTGDAVEDVLARWRGIHPPAEPTPPSIPPAPAAVPSETGLRDPEPPLDQQRLVALRQLGALAGSNLLQRVADLYAKDSAADLVSMQRAVESDRLAELEQALHKLIGTSANIGATRVARLCRTLEGGDLGSIRTTPEDLHRLEEELTAANQALTEALLPRS